MNQPRISIITATFNSAATLADSLASIEQQSYGHIELLVIDGGSTDGTQALIANRFNGLVDHLVSEPDRGIYDALNKGILAASGDIVGLLHSDDVLASPGTLAAVAQAFHDDPTVQAVYGDLVYVRRDAPDTLVRLWRSRPFDPTLLQRGWMPPHPTLYLRKGVFDSVGLFDIRYKIAADYEHVLRIFSKPGIVAQYLPQVMVRMKMGGASNKSLTNLIQKSREDYRAIQTHGVGGFTTLLMKNIAKIGQLRIGQRNQSQTKWDTSQ